MSVETKPTEAEVLSFLEAAAFLRISERTLRRLVAEKKVPYAKIGNLLRFRRTALIEWLQQEERRALGRTEAAPGAGASDTNGSAVSPQPTPETPEERRARIFALAGRLAHVPGSVDEFLRNKQEEIELEEERHRRRWQNGVDQRQ